MKQLFYRWLFQFDPHTFTTKVRLMWPSVDPLGGFAWARVNVIYKGGGNMILSVRWTKEHSLSVIKWAGTVCILGGMFGIALNVGSEFLGFFLYAIGNSLWLVAALMLKEYSLVSIAIGGTAVSFLGMYRWWSG